ncbi:MAG: hypothetical protein H6739_15670 [Alphaproteobacteria bacterium]|nr:hypothetical protein [Alphaproteobacteria bacterium]
MNDSGIFMGWTRTAPGEGAKAMQLYKHLDTYLRTLHAEGRIDRYDMVILGPNGGGVGGFVLIKGNREKLDTLRSSPEFREITVRGNTSLLGFSVVRAHFGDEVRQILGAYQRIAAESAGPAPRWS